MKDLPIKDPLLCLGVVKSTSFVINNTAAILKNLINNHSAGQKMASKGGGACLGVGILPERGYFILKENEKLLLKPPVDYSHN